MARNSTIWFLYFVILTIVCNCITNAAPLRVGFYKSTCPSAEKIVKNVVKNAIARDPGLGAGIIRMHFHDCFVRGCDASVLLDSTPGVDSVKESIFNNPSLRGYEVIDQAKPALEAECPKTVSCAEIVAFAARDSASKLGGIKYAVQSGRRDGNISLKVEPAKYLPAFFFNLAQLQDFFIRKGLSIEEMVTLSGAHSIGRSHCASFAGRLYNFSTTHSQDPSLDPSFANILKMKCPKSTVRNNTIVIDEDFVTPNKLDNKYYQNVRNGKALFISDQTLMTSPTTKAMVKKYSQHDGVW